MSPGDAEPIEALPNLGPKSGAWLREAGIATVGELRAQGAVEAFRRVRERQPRASRNLLWALAAGLSGRDWRDLAPVEKRALLDAERWTGPRPPASCPAS